MEIKSIAIQCLKHSHFISALLMPEKFEFKNNTRNSSFCYDKTNIQTRIRLHDVSIIDDKQIMLFGNFIIAEEKNGCGSDLFFDVPNSSTSISVKGQFETTINIKEDSISMITEFGGRGYQYGANRDNYRLHDPLYSNVIQNGYQLDVFGQVEEAFKVSDGKYVHASSISDKIETIKLVNTEKQIFEKDFFEIYPKGIISRDHMTGELLKFREGIDIRNWKDGQIECNFDHDATDCAYSKPKKRINVELIAIKFNKKKEQEKKERLEAIREKANKKHDKGKTKTKKRR